MSRVDLTVERLPERPHRRLFETARKDLWWVQPLFIFLGLSTFIVYGTWAAFQGDHFHYTGGGADYLSPFYSPVLFDPPGHVTGHAWLGPLPGWWPAWLPYSPALLILWAPGGFRFTCYYYRGAYYKAFWADPPNCAVGEPGFRCARYRGEKKFPLTIQNVHRYFLYIAIGFLFILAYDAFRAFWFTNEAGEERFGIGVGSLVLLINPVLLGGYTLGCHSLRHIVGGRHDCLSKRPVQHKAWKGVSCLNRRHMTWAWFSLVWVGFVDVYVRLCSMGVWTDYRIL